MKLKVIGAFLILAVAVLAVTPCAAAGKAASVTVGGCVKVPPTPSFSFSPVSGTAPLLVMFSSTSSTGVITSYYWEFGDGGTSTDANPQHTYTTPGGPYYPKLTLYGPCGAQVILTSTQSITVTNPAPTFDFTADKPCPCTSNTVKFTCTQTGVTTITSWAWAYEASGSSTWKTLGTTGTGNPLSASFSAAGTYDIRLTVVSGSVSYQLIKPGYIIVISSSSPLTASFTATPTSGPKPLTVKFKDTSTGSCITSEKWENKTSSSSSWKQFYLRAVDSTFTFTATGTYSIRLTVSNACGTSKTSGTQTITVTCPTVTAGMSASPTSVKTGSTVTFSDTTSGPYTSWDLDFGDSTTHATQRADKIPHIYTTTKTKTVTAKLTVKNDCCTSTKTISITVNK
ncbi:MAG: PKD domain-containing protein [Methanomicrobiales archaeon]